MFELKLFFIIIALAIFGFLNDFIGYKFIERQAKKANYNCFKCKDFSCPGKLCMARREEQ